MADDKVGTSGLTLAEAEELQSHLVEGTRVFGMIAVVAHILSFSLSPWLH
jgi:light-harvesting protein B-800-850 beta chain